jgi:hypothetical protein
MTLCSLFFRLLDNQYYDAKLQCFFSIRYLVWINAITAAYSVASILLSSCRFITRFDWLIFLLDQVLLLTSLLPLYIHLIRKLLYCFFKRKSENERKKK